MRARLHRGLMRLIYRHLTKAFNKWMFDARKIREERAAMDYAMRKFLHQALTRAYNGWYDWYLDMKEQERFVRRALARWIKQNLYQAFNKWHIWWAELVAERVALRRAISVWAADGLLRAFTWWREGRLESQLELHSRAALFWLNRSLAIAWHTWRDGCDKNRGLWAIIHRLEMKHRAEKDELLAEIERLRKLLMSGYERPLPVTEDEAAKMLRAVKMWQHLA